jgi:hypothetical protein
MEEGSLSMRIWTKLIDIIMLFFLLALAGIAQNIEQVTIPAGTKFKVRLETPISSKISEVGDKVVVTMLEPLPIDSQHALPRGIEMTGQITQVKRAGQVKGRAEVYALINELTTTYGSESIMVSIVSADDYVNDEKIQTDEEGKLKSNRDLGDDVKKAGAGAGLGSIATAPVAIATQNVGAAIAGPAAGALAGLLLTRGKEIRLAAGTVFRMKFDKPVTIPLSMTRPLSHPSTL